MGSPYKNIPSRIISQTFSVHNCEAKSIEETWDGPVKASLKICENEDVALEYCSDEISLGVKTENLLSNLVILGGNGPTTITLLAVSEICVIRSFKY